MSIFRIIIAAVGRICLSAIFLIAGLNKVLNWGTTKDVLIKAAAAWQDYSSCLWFKPFCAWIPEHIALVLGTAVLFELLGGSLVLLGLFSRFGAFLLILFLFPTTLMFHTFWEMSSPERDIQVVMFMKNISIFGGLCTVLAFGSGYKGCSLSKPSQ